MFGIMLEFANLNTARSLALLRETAQRLKTISNWSWGRRLVAAAVSDLSTLSLTRRERTFLFMDIRDFTAWSERRPPEEVVEMLNAYFETAETV